MEKQYYKSAKNIGIIIEPLPQITVSIIIMKKTILLTLLSVLFIGSITAQNTWLKTFGGTESETVSEVETDDAGNVYVAGRTNADLTIGDSVIKKDGSSSTSIYNIFLIKFDKNGDYVWANMFRAPSTGGASGLAIDKNHNVYLSLWTPSYYYKFDSTGKLLFEKRINGFNAKIGGIQIDDDDNTWIGCSIYDRTVKVDNLPTIDPGDNKAIMFLVKLDSTGKAIQQVPFASNSFTSEIAGIQVRDSFVYAIGNTQADIFVGPDTLKTCDMMVAKFTTNGEYKWSKGITGTDPIGFEYVSNLAVSANHQVVITGGYGDPIFVGNITLPNPAERDQMFLASYDNTGKLMWARHSTSYNTGGVEIEFTPDNTLAFIASYAFRFTYGGINVGDGVFGRRAAVLMEMDSLGNPLWINTLGQTDWNYGDALSIDNEGNWFVSGRYTADPTSNLDGKSVTATGARDLYLLKNFSVPKPSVQSRKFCGGEPIKNIVATGAGIKWYSDSALTNLVYEGATFNVPANTTTSYYVIQKAGGAISEAVKVTATISPATLVTLKTTFPVLTATPQTGKSYKWYADGVEINGAISATYTPTKTGKYHAVLVDSSDCNNYSDTVNYVFTSIDELEKQISVYPNPARDNVIIKGIPSEIIEEISLLSIDGKKLKVYETFDKVLSLQGIQNGVYLISIKTTQNQYVKRLVIQN